MTQARVRAAFETALNTWATAQSVTVAWENVEYTQPEGSYVRAFLLPGQTSSADMGRVHKQWVGIFQMSVVTPTGTGPAAATALVDSLVAAFPPSTALTASGLTVWPTQPLSAAPGIPERDRYAIPCSVPYRADSY